MKYMSEIDCSWHFYLEREVDSKQLLIKILKILQESKMLIVNKYEETEPRGVNTVHLSEGLDLIQEIESGRIVLDIEGGCGFWGMTEIFDGEKWQLEERILELYVSNDFVSRFTLTTNVDIWIPISLDYVFQIESSKLNSDRLATVLEKLQKEFDCVPEPEGVTRNVGMIQNGFRLFNYSAQIEIALEKNKIVPANFNFDAYKSYCQSLIDNKK